MSPSDVICIYCLTQRTHRLAGNLADNLVMELNQIPQELFWRLSLMPAYCRKPQRKLLLLLLFWQKMCYGLSNLGQGCIEFQAEHESHQAFHLSEFFFFLFMTQTFLVFTTPSGPSLLDKDVYTLFCFLLLFPLADTENHFALIVSQWAVDLILSSSLIGLECPRWNSFLWWHDGERPSSFPWSLGWQ